MSRVDDLVSMLLDEDDDDAFFGRGVDLPPLVDFSGPKISSVRTTPSLAESPRQIVREPQKKPVQKFESGTRFSNLNSLRHKAAEHRRKLLLQEAAAREKEQCKFRPDINRVSASVAQRRNANGPSVTERLCRDVEMRKARREENLKLREAEIMAECKFRPRISPMARSMIWQEEDLVVEAPPHVVESSMSFQDFLAARQRPSAASLELSDIFAFTRN